MVNSDWLDKMVKQLDEKPREAERHKDADPKKIAELVERMERERVSK